MSVTVALDNLRTCIRCKAPITGQAYRLAGQETSRIAYRRSPYCSVRCAAHASMDLLGIEPVIPISLQEEAEA